MKPNFRWWGYAWIIMIASMWSLSLFAQGEKKIERKDVPSAVTAAFAKAYPKATIRGYSAEKEGGKLFYEVESVEGKMSRDVLFSPNGSVVEVEESIAPTALPKDAQNMLREKHPKATIRKAERVTRGKTVEYEVSVMEGKKKLSFVFDSTGKLRPHKEED